MEAFILPESRIPVLDFIPTATEMKRKSGMNKLIKIIVKLIAVCRWQMGRKIASLRLQGVQVENRRGHLAERQGHSCNFG